MMARNAEGEGFKISGRHVLIAMITFFGIIFAVNGVFLYQALSTYTGMISSQPYVKGLAYNDRIAADKAQQARGWSETVVIPTERNQISLALKDSAGRPVGGLSITGFVGRPSTRDHDVALKFVETDAGTYVVALNPLDSGNWMLDVNASELGAKGENVVYRLRKRLWLKR